MPGTRNTYAGTDFLSPLRLFRVTRNTDANAAAVPKELDFTTSKTATRNEVLIIANRIKGAGRVNYQFYAKHSGELGDLADPWILHKSTGLQNPLVLIKVTGLFAAAYRIVTVHENGATAEFETHMSSGTLEAADVQSAPLSLSVNFAGTNPVLTWTNSPQLPLATSIEIYLSTARGDLTLLTTVGANTGPYTDLAHLSSDLTFYYAVRAVGPNGSSEIVFSLPRQMAILDVDNAVDTELTITWNTTTGDWPAISLGVEIWQSHESGPFTLIATVPFAGGTYTNTGLTTDDHYDYILREVNLIGNGPFSAVDGATVVGGN